MDGHLLQLAFIAHGLGRTARGVIEQEGCDGTAEPLPRAQSGN